MSVSYLKKKELNPVNKWQRARLLSSLFSILWSADVDFFEMENCRLRTETI